VKVGMANPKYVHYLWKRFGLLSTKTISYKAPDEVKERGIERETGGITESSVIKPFYTMSTRCHPQLRLLGGWYRGGEKVFPSGVDLVPEVLKTWYVGDGNVMPRDGMCRITAVNEMDDFSNILSMFDRIGFSPSTTGSDVWFSVKESAELLDYMGDPPPGFKHKWCLDDREEYERQREKDYQPPEELTR